MCCEPEFNEGKEGWILGKQVGYCYGCARKQKFKRKFEGGTRDDKDESSNTCTELETSKR